MFLNVMNHFLCQVLPSNQDIFYNSRQKNIFHILGNMYFLQMIEKTKKLNVTAQKEIKQIKVGVVGDSTTGKSAFVNRNCEPHQAMFRP